MVKSITRDTLRLSIPAKKAELIDLQTGRDLEETLLANADHCVGMAANMIGIPKAIIAIRIGPMGILMFNPVILKRAGEFETDEGCLSLTGVRKTKRWRTIEVSWQDAGWKKHQQTFTGFPAQVIQHEIDHLSGILI